MTINDAANIMKNIFIELTIENDVLTDEEKDAFVFVANILVEQDKKLYEDAISRKAVIDYVESDSHYSGGWFEMEEDKFIAYLKGLPSVSTEKAGRWIPVSERLPEVNKRVLVTAYGRVCYAMMTSVDGNSGYPIFRLQDSLNERVVCETTVHSKWTTSRIIAWMPLPQPYKAESEAEE